MARVAGLETRQLLILSRNLPRQQAEPDALETLFGRSRDTLVECSHSGERTAAHDVVRDAMHYIIRDASRAILQEKRGFLPSAMLGGRRRRVDLVISEPAASHTLLYVVIADPM